MDSGLRLLDFRHCEGSNQYLTKAETSSELKWVEEDELPKGMDEEMFVVRKRRGDLAKRRIFGKSILDVKLRKLVINKTIDESKLPESDSSDSSSSEKLKMTGAISEMRARDKQLPLSTGLASPSAKQASVLASLSLAVGCRALRSLKQVFQSPSEFELNELFTTMLYKPNTVPLSLKHFVDLMWTALITSPFIPDRDKLLESHFHLVRGCDDILGLKTLEEFVSETTTELHALDSFSFAILERFCDLFIDRRRLGEMELIEDSTQTTVLTETPSSLTPTPFCYASSELDDEGIIALVYRLYEMKNPEKLSDVPGIIEKYKLQLTNLFGILMKKYSIEYSEFQHDKTFVPLEEKRRILHDKLHSLFLLFEPSRLPDIDDIVAYWSAKPTRDVGEYLAKLHRAYYGVKDSKYVQQAKSSEFTSLIMEALAVGNPDVLPKSRPLFEKYSGKEHLLYLAICDKYGLPVDEPRFAEASRRRDARLAAQRTVAMKQILTSIYEEHNPSKLNELDKLIEKLGERPLFDLVTNKYKISLVHKVQMDLQAEQVLEPLAPLAAAIGVVVAFELANPGGVVLAGVPASFLAPLLPPSGAAAGESVIRVRDEDEGQLRDWVEGKVRSAHVTAQEPEYLLVDSFLVTETTRASCVVSWKHPMLFQNLMDHLGTLRAARMHTIFAAPTLTILIGDFRTMLPGVASAYRSRLTVWTTPLVASRPTELIAALMRWPQWLRQCSVFVDQHAQTVSLVGSTVHKASYARGVDYLTARLGSAYLTMVVSAPKAAAAVLAPQLYEWSDASFHESEDDLPDDIDQPATELSRPLRLSRRAMRDSYLQGQLCLNCDETTHKPTDCVLKRKVCWNCHGSHSGSACVFPCRFCKGKHAFGVLECVKKAAKRVADWGKSGTFSEQKSLTAMARSDMRTPEIQRSLATMGMDFVLAAQGGTNLGGFAGLDGIGSIPSDQCPPIPDSRFNWIERFFLDDLVSPSLVGRDILRLLTAQHGAAIKQLESKEQCKIVFKGASAKDLFTTAGHDAADLRFHAVIMCDSAVQASRVKKFLWETIESIEQGLNEGRIPKPPIVEGFAYLEKVHGLQENLYQFDYLNFSSMGNVLEIDLKNRFEFVGDLRHWLHRQGIEVHLGDEGIVGIPPTSKIESILKKPIDDHLGQFVDVFNAFFELITFWSNTPPCGGAYWFEAFELEPVGLLALAHNTAANEAYESGQVVRLSVHGAEHFATLLRSAEYTKEPQEIVVDSLRALRGVVRAIARDARLLMYLRYPWALSASTGTVARDVPETFPDNAFIDELNADQLRKCGRLGRPAAGSLAMNCLDQDVERTRREANAFVIARAKNVRPGDALLARLTGVSETERPYVGYIVDWATPKEVTEYLSGAAPALETAQQDDLMDVVPEAVAEAVAEEVAMEENLNALSVAELKEKLKAKDLPLTGRKVDLIERIQTDLRGGAPVTTLHKCRVELPKALMKWSDIVNNIAGPGDSHFNHIKQQCPSVTLACLGSPSVALVGEARLHVQITATDSADFKKAKSLVEDLVRAVVDVGIDACLSDEPAAVKAAAMKDVKVVSITD